MKKRILLVAMAQSIHVVRWISQFQNEDVEIHLFSSGGWKLHSELKGVIFHFPLSPFAISVTNNKPNKFKLLLQRVYRVLDFFRRRLLERFSPYFLSKRLINVIHKVNPDFVHSLEIQAAGYLVLDAKSQFTGNFPPWLVTNWGSDIYLFGRLQEHNERLRDVLANCNYYSCECERDINLAKKFGFNGQVMPVFTNTGGFDLSKLIIERAKVPTSSRKVILLKGYQNWAGRALVGLRALERCIDLLGGYEIYIYSASPDLELAAKLFEEAHGVSIKIIPDNTSHKDMLSLHANARVSIGLSISDGVSTSFLEAIVMGSFPIQSCTACANEWIEHGVGGMIVPPEDPDIVEINIRKALTDDKLVDKAAEYNWKVIEQKLCKEMVRINAVSIYQSIFNET